MNFNWFYFMNWKILIVKLRYFITYLFIVTLWVTYSSSFSCFHINIYSICRVRGMLCHTYTHIHYLLPTYIRIYECFVKVLIKWLNLHLPINLSFWDKWWFNMVSKPKVLSSNLDFIIYLLFQLTILHVGPCLLKREFEPTLEREC
jgi:hypothetical protein